MDCLNHPYQIVFHYRTKLFSGINCNRRDQKLRQTRIHRRDGEEKYPSKWLKQAAFFKTLSHSQMDLRLASQKANFLEYVQICAQTDSQF